MSALGAALLLGGTGSLTAAAQVAPAQIVPAQVASARVARPSMAAQGQAAEDDPLQLFAQMMPAFSSPRCSNCHGGTNPQTDTNHEGGQVDVPLNGSGDMRGGIGASDACLECHTDAPPSWRLAPHNMLFVGKDTLPLCRQIRTTNGLDTGDPAALEAFVRHIENDPLIALGFAGQGAIGKESAFAPITPDPPGITLGQMVTAAQEWTQKGHARCSNKWTGTITYTLTAQEKVQFREAGTELKVTIDVAENEATATTHYTMHDFTDVATKECQTMVHHTWTADGKGKADFQLIETPSIPAGGLDLSAIPGMPDLSSIPGMPDLTNLLTPPSLPDGTQPRLPPGQVMPSLAPGGLFLLLTLPEATGTHHSETRTLPGCKTVNADEKYSYVKSNLSANPTLDPNDPDHLKGEQSQPSTTGSAILKWDLRRGN
jgi:hypothetical protein